MIGERIEQIIKVLFHGNVRQFSLKIGIPSGQIANYIRGRSSIPRVDVIEKIVLSIDDINVDWLITGRGNMLKSEQKKEQAQSEIEYYLEKKLNEKEKRIEELLIELGKQMYENKMLLERSVK